MNALLLINHQTASKFYCEILKTLGYDVYIPLRTLRYGLGYDAVKEYRTINNNDIAQELDNFDFYQTYSIDKINKIMALISNNFQIVIALVIINRELLKMLSVSPTLRVYFVLWGSGETCNHYDFVHNNILNTPNKYYLIAHDYLVNKYVSLYGIPTNKYKYYQLGLYLKDNSVINSCSHIKNEVVIIISRIHLEDKRFFNLIVKIANNLSNVKFHVFGVDNQVSFVNSPNVTLHDECKNVEDIYANIKNFRLAVNFSIYEDVLQYSPVEFATIGIPFLYPSTGALAKVIGHSDVFTYKNIDELCDKIKYLITDNNLDKYEDEYKKINTFIHDKYKFENLIDSYKDI